jgi:hypothetical protein
VRYAIASLFALLVIGMASAVPDGPESTATWLPMASNSGDCERALAATDPYDIATGPEIVAGEPWNELRAEPQRGGAPSADVVSEATAAVYEMVACLNTLGRETERTALVWIGEPWLLPDERVVAPAITRRGSRPELRRLVVLERDGERYIVDEMLTVGARNAAQTASPFLPPSGRRL